MRINRYLAYRYGSSRRDADQAIAAGEVYVNSSPAAMGQQINASTDVIVWAGHTPLQTKSPTMIMLNKPVGHVCSKHGQGAPTIYDLLPQEYSHLIIAGRLDKDSCGLVILTSDGQAAQELSHPSHDKLKHYHVRTTSPISSAHIRELMLGVDIGDTRPSRMSVTPTGSDNTYLVVLGEGRNRQIRRSLSALGYQITLLHRVQLGNYQLGALASGKYSVVDAD